jgi:hypothetical protein
MVKRKIVTTKDSQQRPEQWTESSEAEGSRALLACVQGSYKSGAPRQLFESADKKWIKCPCGTAFP